MRYTYKGLSSINGPLIFLKNTHNVANEEIVKIKDRNGNVRLGRVLELSTQVVCIEVFQGTAGLSLEETEIEFLDHTFKIGVSRDMLGRKFNGLGETTDFFKDTHKKKPPIIPEVELSVNGSPINPWAREYPRDVIITGISAIDGLNSLIRGQKLPIFSGQGLYHNKLASQIVKQARVLTREPFLVVFCGIGILQDDAIYFQRSFEQTGAIQNVISFINLAEDPTIERLLIPRLALTTAEYFAFQEHMHVLVVMLDITNYAEALREISSAKGEIPSRKGFPGYMYSDFASLYERAGRIKNIEGSVTFIPIISMPNDDITHPIPDLTGYITEGQIVLSRSLHHQGIYPSVEVLSSLSRLMKEGVGEKQTRGDHMDVAGQLYSLYSESLEVRELESIIGFESLSQLDRKILQFGKDFENQFLDQDPEENRDIEETLNIAWEIIRNVPRQKLIRISEKWLRKYYVKKE